MFSTESNLSPFGLLVDASTQANLPLNLREQVLKHKLILLRGSRHDRESLLELAQSLSTETGGIEDRLLHWDFGPIMEMKAQQCAKNYLFSEQAVPFHWDGAFYREPMFLIFYCTHASGSSGGETLFANTEALYEDLSVEQKLLFEKVTICYETEKKAHYGGQIQVPVMATHPIKKSQILRFGERVQTNMNPVKVTLKGVSESEAEDFYQSLSAKLYEDRYCYSHKWKEGDLLIADNFSLLHGRRSLGSNLKRSFLRLQVL